VSCGMWRSESSIVCFVGCDVLRGALCVLWDVTSVRSIVCPVGCDVLRGALCVLWDVMF
jgi:hypothetical protein